MSKLPTKCLYKTLMQYATKNLLKFSIIYAIAFAIYETLYRQITQAFELDNSDHKYTTVEQFIITFCWTPVILYHKKIESLSIRFLTFPLNIYLCELIFGSVLLLYDIRAWHYTDDLSFFDGLISFKFYPVWVCIGFIEHILYIFTSLIIK